MSALSGGRRAIAEVLAGVALAAVAALFVLVAVAFAFAAAYRAADDYVGPIYACLLTGGIAVLMAALFFRAARRLMTSPASPDTAMAPTASRGAAGRRLVQEYPLPSVAAALVAGLAVGASPQARQAAAAGLRAAAREKGLLH